MQRCAVGGSVLCSSPSTSCRTARSSTTSCSRRSTRRPARRAEQPWARTALERVASNTVSTSHPRRSRAVERQRASRSPARWSPTPAVARRRTHRNLDTKNSAGIMDLFDELHADGLTLVVIHPRPRGLARAVRRVRIYSAVCRSSHDLPTSPTRGSRAPLPPDRRQRWRRRVRRDRTMPGTPRDIGAPSPTTTSPTVCPTRRRTGSQTSSTARPQSRRGPNACVAQPAASRFWRSGRTQLDRSEIHLGARPDRFSLRDLFAEAAHGIGAKPGRLVLTILGTVLGIGSVVVTWAWPDRRRPDKCTVRTRSLPRRLSGSLGRRDRRGAGNARPKNVAAVGRTGTGAAAQRGRGGAGMLGTVDIKAPLSQPSPSTILQPQGRVSRVCGRLGRAARRGPRRGRHRRFFDDGHRSGPTGSWCWVSGPPTSSG